MDEKKHPLDMLNYKAYRLRRGALIATTAAGSGHLTSALSAADLVAALFFYSMQYNQNNPFDENNDRFILSKGHAIPVVYAAWREVGVLTEEELKQYRQLHSPLEGHPTPRFPYNEAATGSLGQGLSIGLGMALSRRFSQKKFYTYVMLGDSEMTEGSCWEAIALAPFYKADRLIAIVDLNRLGQSTETIDDHHPAQHAVRWRAFGWQTLIIDGHDMASICQALDEAQKLSEKPVVIIAQTYKGYGLTSIEDKEGFHGKAQPKDQLEQNLDQLKERFFKKEYASFEEPTQVTTHIMRTVDIPAVELTVPKAYLAKNSAGQSNQQFATRQAYGEALRLLGAKLDNLIVLDAEVKNSTYAERFEETYPDRFIQSFVAEQNMVGMATGLTLRTYITFSSTFASFLTRAHDQIRMAAIGRVPLRIAGSHAGVSIGQDGPSQMGLEDIALMRALPGSAIVYPADAVSTIRLMSVIASRVEGISYIRLTRAITPTIYSEDTQFTLGGSHVLKESPADVAVIVSAGITLHQALKAYDILKAEGLPVAVLDLYSIKPLDVDRVKQLAQKNDGRVITVEDHYPEGGIGEAVLSALRDTSAHVTMLAVQRLPRSGSPTELLAYESINAQAIVTAVKARVKK